MVKQIERDRQNMSFEDALKHLKCGGMVARHGWNGRNMCLYMVPKAEYPAMTLNAKLLFGEGSMVPYEAYIAMKNAQGTVSVWAPSQVDLMADDWCVVDLDD